MKKTFSAGGVVLSRQGQILVVNQNHNSWSLPKGHVEPGESLYEAAVREIEEETGICQLEYLMDLGFYQRFRIGLDGQEDKQELKQMTFFLFRTNSIDIQLKDPAHPEGRWVNPDQVANLLTHPKDREFFLSILDKINPYL